MLTYCNINPEYALSRKSFRGTRTCYVQTDGKTDRHKRLSLVQAPNNESFGCADRVSIPREAAAHFFLNAHDTEIGT